MLDTTTAAVLKAAQEGYDAFERETVTRHDASLTSKTIVKLVDGRPDWVYEAVYKAHGEMLPDDWVYDKARDALQTIVEAGEDTDLDEVRATFCDGAVDIYSHDRLAWLSSSLNRPNYCDEAAAEGLVAPEAGMTDRAGAGQYMEAQGIWSAIADAVQERAEEIDDEGDENDG